MEPFDRRAGGLGNQPEARGAGAAGARRGRAGDLPRRSAERRQARVARHWYHRARPDLHRTPCDASAWRPGCRARAEPCCRLVARAFIYPPTADVQSDDPDASYQIVGAQAGRPSWSGAADPPLFFSVGWPRGFWSLAGPRAGWTRSARLMTRTRLSGGRQRQRPADRDIGGMSISSS